uniref:DUF59 domain-containing protein n=1 Tax=candidate division WOR-3 bacterium TaxID=2052148 RepID=A0A7C4CD64_UNCW3
MPPGGRARLFATLFLVIAGLSLVALPRFLRSRHIASFSGLRPIAFRAAGLAPFCRPDTNASCPDSTRIAQALASVPDPELPLNIVELGLVQKIATDASGRVEVVIGLTTPLCPYGAELARAALDAVVRIPGVCSAVVSVDPQAVWDPARVSEEIRYRLSLIPRQ